MMELNAATEGLSGEAYAVAFKQRLADISYVLSRPGGAAMIKPGGIGG